jgi:hypothetical protein
MQPKRVRRRASDKTVPAQVCTNLAAIRLVTGKSRLDVALWQVDNAPCNAGFRNPDRS